MPRPPLSGLPPTGLAGRLNELLHRNPHTYGKPTIGDYALNTMMIPEQGLAALLGQEIPPSPIWNPTRADRDLRDDRAARDRMAETRKLKRRLPSPMWPSHGPQAGAPHRVDWNAMARSQQAPQGSRPMGPVMAPPPQSGVPSWLQQLLPQR